MLAIDNLILFFDINKAINYSDEIIAMKDGKILFQGVHHYN